MSHSHDVAGASEIEELCKRLLNFRRENGTLSGAECQLTMEAATLIRRLVAERDEAREERDIWRSVFPDIAPASVVPNRSLLESRATAAEAEVDRLRAENAELKAWKKRRQEEDEDEADRREIW